jgi:hypothetical protein
MLEPKLKAKNRNWAAARMDSTSEHSVWCMVYGVQYCTCGKDCNLPSGEEFLVGVEEGEGRSINCLVQSISSTVC